MAHNDQSTLFKRGEPKAHGIGGVAAARHVVALVPALDSSFADGRVPLAVRRSSNSMSASSNVTRTAAFPRV